MKIQPICSSILALFFALGAQVLAQTTTTTPGSVNPAPETVYKAVARSVIVDVVVTDSSGRPVTGLTRDKFHVQESGQPQTVSFFEPHVRPATTPPVVAPRPMPPGEYSNIPSAPVSASVNVLLLDALNTPLANQVQVRQAMVKYLKTAPPGTRMAIFTLGLRLRFVQGFTADPTVLLAALDSKKNKSAIPQTSAILTTPEESAQQDQLTDMMSDGGASAQAVAGMQQFMANEESFKTDIRVRETLEAMQQIARYLAGVPGRKNLIWFSGSFPVNIFPDATAQDPFSASRDYSEDIHKTTDLLTIGQVAVYPVDARGLMVAPMYDVSNSGSHYGRNPGNFAAANTKFEIQTISEHTAMDEIARATGGAAIYNTNGLKEALERVIDNGSNYYTIAYTPTDKTLDGKLRKINITLDDKKYKLAYRRSYFADDVNGKHTTNAPTADKSFLSAMSPGLPEASQILMKVRVLPLDPQPSPQPVAAQLIGDNTKLKGPTIRFGIEYAASVRDLQMTATPDGVNHGVITMSIVAYDREGDVQNSLTRTMRLDLSPATYAGMLKSGMHLHTQIDLPQGAIYLRTGIYDVASGNMGILEAPLYVRPAAEKK